MTEAARLIEIVEGLKGAIEHGTWRDEKGMRLKDTKEWMEFYVATRSPFQSPSSPPNNPDNEGERE